MKKFNKKLSYLWDGSENKLVLFYTRRLMIIHLTPKIILLNVVALWVSTVLAAPRLANVFTDNMVLQRDMRACIWGTGKAAEEVVVSFAGQEKNTIVNADGNWKLYLDPMKANATSQILSVKDSDGTEIAITNVLVGDVWFFSGAGHERTMNRLGSDSGKLLPQANHSFVRVLRPNNYNSLYPVSDINADCRWIEVNSKSIAYYSISWCFGKHLYGLTNVPVGIVLATKASQDSREFFAWEGTQLSSINQAIFAKLPGDIAAAQRWLKSMQNYKPGDKIDILPFPAYIPYEYYFYSPSFDNRYPYPNARGSVFNAMVYPLRNMTLRAVVLFNEFTGKATFPDYTLTEIVPKWRAQFGQSQLPFVIPEMRNSEFSNRFNNAVEKAAEVPFIQIIKKDELKFTALDEDKYWEKLVEIANNTPMYKQEVSERVPALPKAEIVQVPDSSIKLRTSHVFSSNMVLQRDMPLKVWGWTPMPNKEVTLNFAGESKSVKSNDKCRWEVNLSPLAMSKNPQTMTIASDKEKLVYGNILVGDVWLNSGQSNAGFAMQGTFSYKEEVEKPLSNEIRYFYNTKTACILPLRANYQNGWKRLDRETLGKMSGQGYYFAKEINAELDVPVGIIEANMGGAHISRFITVEAIAGNSELSNFYDEAVTERKRTEENVPGWVSEVERWVEGAKENAALARSMPPFPIDQSAFRPFYSEHQNLLEQRGATLFNTMIGPMKGLAFMGVLWNQGEADRFPPMINVYDKLSAAMVSHWRMFFDNDFPFYFVSMPAIKNQDALLTFWEKQYNATKLIPKSAMIVSNDISEADASLGHAIHPRNKKDVGKRLALLALSRTYGKKGFVDSSPFMQNVVREANKMIVTFSPVGEGLTTRDDKEPDSWEIAGADHKFVAAKAVIQNDKVIVIAKGINTPVTVRLGWKSDSNCNLVNSAGLPAMPFNFKVAVSAAKEEFIDIVFAGGQSNATGTWVRGIEETLKESGKFSNLKMVHVQHSGEWMQGWYTDRPQKNFDYDFYNANGTGALEQMWKRVEDSGKIPRLAGFFWWQGEGDTGGAETKVAYTERFNTILELLTKRFKQDAKLNFALAIIDGNHDPKYDDPEVASGRTRKMIEEMRNIHKELGEQSNGVAVDTRGAQRRDLWHLTGNAPAEIGKNMANAFLEKFNNTQ